MKHIRFLIFVTLIAGVVLPLSAQRRSPTVNDRVGEIERTMLEWQDSVRSMDVGRFASHYWDDALRIFVFPSGGRHVIEGLEAIAEQQEAAFRQIRREEPELFRQFTLPEPEILGLPERLPIFIYRSPDGGSFQMFQFEERFGRVAISRHTEIVREVEPVEAGEEYAWADENTNGILEPHEQTMVVDQFLLMTRGEHRARGFLDNWFDWDGNGTVDGIESERAMIILYRDGLRQGYRFFPEFAEFYGDLDHSGSISIQEADLAIAAALRPGAEVPRPLSTPLDERMDVDMDGWIIPPEIETFVYALTRAVASIPGLPLTNPGTPPSAQGAVWWADADESGFLDETELRDVGTILQRLVASTEIGSNPIELRYDTNRDYMISAVERNAAREELFGLVSPEEREFLSQIAVAPERLFARRPSTPLEHEMDIDPEDGRLAEHEVFGYLERRFTGIAEVWFANADGAGRQIVAVPDDRFAGGTTGTGQTDRGSDGEEEAGDAGPAPSDDAVVVKVLTRPTAVADQVGDELTIAVSLNPVYPVLRKYYDTAPLGSVTLSNTSAAALTNLEVTLSLSKYIDQARTYDEIESLGAGESVSMDLTLLLNSTVLDITQGDRVDATVSVAFSGAAGATQETATETMIFYDRNAIRWDDTRKVAAFVTERDGEIRSYARRVIAGIRDERNDAVDEALQDAMALFIAMVESDVMYFRDPSSSYSSASSSGATIDYLQFPRQTLTDYGGDCDDLSVAFNALLESIGRRTAFITVPGHILPAVALQMSAGEARSAFMDPTDLVFDAEGTVWVPVEITALEGSFYEAWQDGAKTYRQYSGSGQAEIIPTATAWNTYESVASVVDDAIDQPDQSAIAAEFSDALSEFVNTQIATRELQYQADLVDKPGDRRLLNRLGVLYAQYGLWEKAQAQFEAIVETEDYVPALLNLGHIAYLDEEYRSAAAYYDKVLGLQSAHANALLAAARAHHELENYGNVRTYYEQLRGLSPRLAADYSYLDLSSSNETARAQAASQLKGRVTWEESEEE